MAAKRARSAKGEIVDFDILAIQQQLANNPAPTTVQARRNFIDKKEGAKHQRIGTITPDSPAATAPVPESPTIRRKPLAKGS